MHSTDVTTDLASSFKKTLITCLHGQVNTIKYNTIYGKDYSLEPVSCGVTVCTTP